ncbi:MAG: HD domain-containing protein [Pseudonocardiaceae bacterium]|nr:HD domain-containing protein [Pseudonocardiaceae bacterium]
MHPNGSNDRTVGGILGRDGVYRDPMWEIEVRLSALEQRLLRTWELRRLQFVSHAGAPVLTTLQTYSRLEHSLGLFALAARFAPDDALARTAALLHDIGHLPFSHTFEGVADLRHHELGAARIRRLAPLLGEHGMRADDVLATESGASPSILHAPAGALKLDHLESLLRSGRAHGRLIEPPAATLARLRIVDGAVDTDASTAGYLAELAVGEASYLCSWEASVANGVVRGLVEQLATGRHTDSVDLAARIPDMTDDELWGVLLAHPHTAEHAHRLRADPLSWQLRPGHDGAEDGYRYQIERLYLDMPCVAGKPIELPASAAARIPELPWRCTITPANS